VWIMGIVFSFNLMNKKLFTSNPAAYVENIVDAMSEVVIVLNIDYYIETVKGPVKEVLGYSLRDLTGTPLKQIMPMQWDSFVSQTIHGLDTLSITGHEYELVTHKGGLLPVKISASSHKNSDGRVQGYILVVTDLSPIKELLHVEAERNKLAVITESITDLIVAVDFDQKIVLANKAFKNFTNGSDVIGKNISEIMHIDTEGTEIPIKSLIQSGTILKDTIIAQHRRIQLTINAQTILANVTSSAIKEGSKVNMAGIIVMQDLTEEQELEKMKLDFVSMAAHELRTPLTAIRGYVEALREEIQESLSEQQTTFLNRIDSATLQLTGLMENLLSASRIEKGTYNLNIVSTDWVALVNNAIKNHETLAKEAEVTIHFNMPTTTIPQVNVDALRINEVINNLLSNAIKYSPKGKVFINIHYDDIKEMITTSIKDDGQGIPSTALPHMFEKFFRVWGTLEMGSKGTGLGLYIARAIVALHKGTIWVESEGEGKGSVFSFSLPLDLPISDFGKPKPNKSS